MKERERRIHVVKAKATVKVRATLTVRSNSPQLARPRRSGRAAVALDRANAAKSKS